MSVSIIATSAATQDVVNTTTETSVFAPTVPANTIGSTDFVVCEILGDLLINSASTTYNLRIKFGGTTYYNDQPSFAAVDANRSPIYLYIVLAGNNTTTAQTLGGVWANGTRAGATTGIGDFNVDEILAMTPLSNDGVAIDQTADRTLDITWQFTVASASASFRRHFASLTSFKV